ncbi:phosphatase PAP2 family protein [Bacillus sp. 37MA]|uniref:phosphatase PAP2 family protein n=1 Tax=Bacillus sp. 37MA TaxID=1132442 RepID=UPI00036E880E|nr:phosphatase PAP2 family protein [Bacillus sp. 37MA]
MIWGGLVCLILFVIILTGWESEWAGILDDHTFQILGENSFLPIFSFLGSEMILGGGAVLLICFLAWKRNIIGAIAILIGVGGGNILNKALKEWVARERPAFPHGEDGFSFVSGHAMVSIIFYLLLAYFLSIYTNKKRIAYSAALLLAFLSGISRVAEKAHYATDAAAGWLLGAAIYFLLASILNRRLPKKAA